jgi:hypothetical protein
MKRPALFLTIAFAIGPSPAYSKCHIYKYWGFKVPQRCGMVRQLVRPSRPAKASPEPPVGPGMPIPALDWTPVAEPDELARARLLLRAAMENADAH